MGNGPQRRTRLELSVDEYGHAVVHRLQRQTDGEQMEVGQRDQETVFCLPFKGRLKMFTQTHVIEVVVGDDDALRIAGGA